MLHVCFDIIKVLIVFIVFSCLFYFGLIAIHSEYKQYHRYDVPQGNVVKVSSDDQPFVKRLHLFFQLGE